MATYVPRYVWTVPTSLAANCHKQVVSDPDQIASPAAADAFASSGSQRLSAP